MEENTEREGIGAHAEAVRAGFEKRGAPAAITRFNEKAEPNESELQEGKVVYRGSAALMIHASGHHWKILLWDPVNKATGKDPMDEDLLNGFISFNIGETPEKTAAGLVDRSLDAIAREIEWLDGDGGKGREVFSNIRGIPAGSREKCLISDGKMEIPDSAFAGRREMPHSLQRTFDWVPPLEDAA